MLERLLHEPVIPRPADWSVTSCDAEPAHEDDRQVRPQLPQRRRRFEPAHPRHGQVQHDGVDLPRRARGTPASLPARPSAASTVRPACSRMRAATSRTAFSSSITRTVPVPRQPSGGREHDRRRGGLRRAGEQEAERTSPAGFAADLEVPRCPRAMPWTTARPSPRPVNFVVKKGSKILSITSAVIPHPESATSRKTAGPSGSSAPRGGRAAAGRIDPVRTVTVPPPSADGLGGVRDQVHDDLAELRGVGLHGGQRRGQVVPEFGVRIDDRRAQQAAHLADEGGQVDRLDDEPALARVGQDLLHEVGGPAGVLRRPLRAWARPGEPAGKRLGGEFGEPEDRRQHVVQVVGDPPGQDAQTLQLLGLEHLGLQLAPLLLAPPDGVDEFVLPDGRDDQRLVHRRRLPAEDRGLRRLRHLDHDPGRAFVRPEDRPTSRTTSRRAAFGRVPAPPDSPASPSGTRGRGAPGSRCPPASGTASANGRPTQFLGRLPGQAGEGGVDVADDVRRPLDGDHRLGRPLGEIPAQARQVERIAPAAGIGFGTHDSLPGWVAVNPAHDAAPGRSAKPSGHFAPASRRSFS